MKQRTVLHIDGNAFYASCELCYRPELRGKPMVVGGDEAARHGIVLAKTDEAKKFGIKTGNSLRDARQHCPGLIVLPPDYRLYWRFSRMVRAIFDEYTDRVEPFGLDESWLDVSEPGKGLDHGVKVADEIRARIKRELGITVSVGVADNKIMAKLGSDYKKPDATTLFHPNYYPWTVFQLSVSDLLGVGPATAAKLARIGVTSIWQLAAMEPEHLIGMFGKVGYMLHVFANGKDTTPVHRTDPGTIFAGPMESIGNSATMPRDLTCDVDVRLAMYLMAESVAARLRECGLRARGVEIYIRDNELHSVIRQHKMKRATCISAEIAEEAMRLFQVNYDITRQLPLRSVGVRSYALETEHTAVQLSLLRTTKSASAPRRLSGRLIGCASVLGRTSSDAG